MLFTFWSTERCFSSSWLACRVNDFRPLCNTSLGNVRPGSSKRLISASTSTRVIQKANNSFILPFVFGAYQKKYNEFGTVAASSEGAFWGAKISSTAGVNFCFFVGCFSSPALAGSVFDSSSFFLINVCGLLLFSFFVSFAFLLFKLCIFQGRPDSRLGLQKMQYDFWLWTNEIRTHGSAFRMSPAVSEVSICIASAAVLARAHSASVKLGGAASSGCLSCWKMWFNRHIGEFCNHIRSVLENTLHKFFAFVKPFLITFHGIFCWIRLGLGKFLQVMDQVGTGKFV